MHPTPIHQASLLLTLPREVRDHILGELFFPGEKELPSFSQDSLGLAPTAHRQIWPYDTNPQRKPRFCVAVLRTCRQLQDEAEEVLYGTSSFNLMYQDWADPVKQSYEFFERLPKRLRRRVRRVERKCYSRPYQRSISLVDWKLFMTFLARECPQLHSLKLWGPGDPYEGPLWVGTCRQDEEWVQAMLQIKTLRFFDIPAIRGSVIYNYPEFRDNFLPWLKRQMVQQPPASCITVAADESHPRPASTMLSNTPFRFLDLPRSIRNAIYTAVLLPSSHRIHPTIKPWYDTTTLNLVPLLLTSRQLYAEASALLSAEAIFTSPLRKYDTALEQLLGTFRHPGGTLSTLRTPARIKHLRLTLGAEYDSPLLVFAAHSLRVEHLQLVLSAHQVLGMNEGWPRHWWAQGPSPGDAPDEFAWWPESLTRVALLAIVRVPDVRVESAEAGAALRPEPRTWLEGGMRRVWLGEFGEMGGTGLEWLVEDRMEGNESDGAAALVERL